MRAKQDLFNVLIENASKKDIHIPHDEAQDFINNVVDRDLKEHFCLLISEIIEEYGDPINRIKIIQSIIFGDE